MTFGFIITVVSSLYTLISFSCSFLISIMDGYYRYGFLKKALNYILWKLTPRLLFLSTYSAVTVSETNYISSLSYSKLISYLNYFFDFFFKEGNKYGQNCFLLFWLALIVYRMKFMQCWRDVFSLGIESSIVYSLFVFMERVLMSLRGRGSVILANSS